MSNAIAHANVWKRLSDMYWMQTRKKDADWRALFRATVDAHKRRVVPPEAVVHTRNVHDEPTTPMAVLRHHCLPSSPGATGQAHCCQCGRMIVEVDGSWVSP